MSLATMAVAPAVERDAVGHDRRPRSIAKGRARGVRSCIAVERVEAPMLVQRCTVGVLLRQVAGLLAMGAVAAVALVGGAVMVLHLAVGA